MARKDTTSDTEFSLLFYDIHRSTANAFTELHVTVVSCYAIRFFCQASQNACHDTRYMANAHSISYLTILSRYRSRSSSSDQEQKLHVGEHCPL